LNSSKRETVTDRRRDGEIPTEGRGHTYCLSGPVTPVTGLIHLGKGTSNYDFDLTGLNTFTLVDTTGKQVLLRPAASSNPKGPPLG
jgi:hypothetical protein